MPGSAHETVAAIAIEFRLGIDIGADLSFGTWPAVVQALSAATHSNKDPRSRDAGRNTFIGNTPFLVIPVVLPGESHSPSDFGPIASERAAREALCQVAVRAGDAMPA